MCGINGIAFSESSGRQIEPGVLVRMRDVLTHRGPDDSGIYVDKNIGIAHRRLSIVDVEHGAQPMANNDGSCVVVFNGEIYNHREYRELLTGQGHTFQNRSDTETILHLYEAYGRDCVSHLRGMFAFAIGDKATKELFLARDRFGVKPLYYVHDAEGNFFFASEIKALLEAKAVRPEVNFAALPDQFANHGTSGEDTLFSGVKRLLPGHTLVWKNGKIDILRFWDLSFEPKNEDLSDDDLVESWLELFRESVELRLMSDVPLGVFLSGGIDSSAILAMMSELVAEPIKSFSIGFRERDANELEYARLVSERFGSEHFETVITPSQFFESIPDLVWHEDEPMGFIASVPLYFVSKLAQQHVKVVLTGEGSDETLAGYGRYSKAIKLLSFGQTYETVAPTFLRNALRTGVDTLPSHISTKLGRTFLTRDARVQELFLDNFSVFGQAAQRSLFSKSSKERIADTNPFVFHDRLLSSTDAQDELDKLLYLDTKTYLHELLMKQDQMSMAASIESRVPFLDHKLVEFTAQMPRRMKLRGRTTKWVLRKAMRGILPDPIIDRPKMGFPVPVGNWFRGPFRSVIDDYVLGDRAMSRGIFDPTYIRGLVKAHQAGESHDERLWSLVNFEIWLRTFIDGEGGA